MLKSYRHSIDKKGREGIREEVGMEGKREARRERRKEEG